MVARTTAQRTAWVVAAALLIFALRLSFTGGGAVGIAFLFTIPVGLATWWFGRRAGLWVAAACVGLYLAAVAIRPVDQVLASTAVRAVTLLAVVLVVGELRARTASLAATVDELDSLRLALTPPTLPQLPGLDAAVAFLPAEHGVSGDFYLLTNGPRGTNIAIVGDVCGHGPAAAKQATFARATLASVAASCVDPAEILDLVNRTLIERWEGGDYMTACCIVHDPVVHTVRWATAGHPPPIRLSDLTELPTEDGTPLGVYQRVHFRSQQLPLPPPDGVLMYTDGLLDARRGADRYGEKRLHDTLTACATSPPAEIVQSLRRSVSQYAGDRFKDDVCVLALRAAAASPG
jgi:serine phosphatase RsbU (regulator of sigma subunit)